MEKGLRMWQQRYFFATPISNFHAFSFNTPSFLNHIADFLSLSKTHPHFFGGNSQKSNYFLKTT
jgi:hypothetical protein